MADGAAEPLVAMIEGWWRRLAGVLRGWDGSRGRPRSSNGASSLHLVWDVPVGRWVAAEATLEIEREPAVAALYFWALQVSFVEGGRRGGGAHLGLQWYPPHPDSRAVNWGGYGPGGVELTGTTSQLPSATGNPNTRDYPWRVGRPYRLGIERSVTGVGWTGWVLDVESDRRTVVRELDVGGTHLEAPMVWSEVFADCDAPAVGVRWSGLCLTAADGSRVDVERVRVNYQTLADGGCATGDSSAEGDAFVQRSGVERNTRQGAWLSTNPSRS